MQVSTLQENLHKALAIVARFTASRSTLPVLSNVLLATDNGKLKLSATNLEIGINCQVGAKVASEGAITIPARLLSDFVNSLPPERIDLKLDESTQTLNLKCSRYESNIKGIAAGEFPVVPVYAESSPVKLEPDILKAMIEQTAFAAASDESRPILTGVLVQFAEDSLTLAAADGFRLSVKRTNGMSGLEPTEAIIPARALVELARLMGDQDKPVEVVISPARKQILFHLDGIDVISQLIEGRFPDYTQIIPKGYNTRSVMDTAALLKAAKLSHLFARDSANIVKLEITPGSDNLMTGRVTLIATSAELGDNVADVDATIEGPGMTVAFNTKYLIDVLGVIDSPQVEMQTNSSAQPGVFRGIGDGGFTHVVMPMHIER